jgi:hypothetical protein
MPKKYPFTQVQLVTWICPKIGDMLAGSIFYISTSDGHLFDFSCIPGLFTETTIKFFGDYATPCDPAWRDTNLFLEGRFQLKGGSVFLHIVWLDT